MEWLRLLTDFSLVTRARVPPSPPAHTEVRPIANSPLAFKAPAVPLTFETIIQGWLLEKKPNKKTE